MFKNDENENENLKLTQLYESHTIPVFNNFNDEFMNKSLKQRVEYEDKTEVKTVDISSGFKFIFYTENLFLIAKNSNFRELSKDLDYFNRFQLNESSYNKTINSVKLHVPKNIERHQNIIIQINHSHYPDSTNPKVSFLLIKNEKGDKAPIRLWTVQKYDNQLPSKFMAELALDHKGMPDDVMYHIKGYGGNSKSKRIKKKILKRTKRNK
jgi:hypothetical protein